MLLFVGTPNLASRMKRLEEKLESSSVSSADRNNALSLVSSYSSENWATTRFLTFAENESLSNLVVAYVVSCFIASGE